MFSPSYAPHGSASDASDGGGDNAPYQTKEAAALLVRMDASCITPIHSASLQWSELTLTPSRIALATSEAADPSLSVSAYAEAASTSALWSSMSVPPLAFDASLYASMQSGTVMGDATSTPDQTPVDNDPPPSPPLNAEALTSMLLMRSQAGPVLQQLHAIHGQLHCTRLDYAALRSLVHTVDALLISLLATYVPAVDLVSHLAQTQVAGLAYELAWLIHDHVALRASELGKLNQLTRHFRTRAHHICTHSVYLRERRSNHPQGAVAICRRWLFAHRHHPYPTADEKNELCHQTGLRLSQINDWFVNARRRYLSKGEHRSDTPTVEDATPMVVVPVSVHTASVSPP